MATICICPRQPFLNGVEQKRAQGFQLGHVQKGDPYLLGLYQKGVVLMGKIAGSFTNAPSGTETIQSRLVVNHNSLSCNFQLYMLGHSPICVNEVEKSLENYPYKDIVCELIKGLQFGFPLNYSGPRSPITLKKNLKSVADMPELTKQTNFKRISNGKNCRAIFSPPFSNFTCFSHRSSLQKEW